MKIFIRADGGKCIGLGHIMRMIVLGKELRKNNEVIFICKKSEDDKFKAGIEKVKESNFNVIEISEENYIEDIINIQNKYVGHVIITDSYEVDEEYFVEMKKYFILSGYVDDVNRVKMDVDFIINQNINAAYMDYRKTTNDITKLFLGTKYCMVREEFQKASSEKIKKDEVQDILLTLGGMDKDYNTKRIINMIKDCKKNIYVVLGSAFDEKLNKYIYDLSKDYSNIYPCENANMSELMKKCSISITACGSTLYELCVMQVPAIALIVADNQECVANIMKEKELVLDVFKIKGLDKNMLIHSLNTLINNKSIRESIIKKQRNIINVNGACTLAHEIEKLAFKLLG